MCNVEQGLFLSLLFPYLRIDRISSLFFKVINKNKRNYCDDLASLSSHSLAFKINFDSAIPTALLCIPKSSKALLFRYSAASSKIVARTNSFLSVGVFLYNSINSVSLAIYVVTQIDILIFFYLSKYKLCYLTNFKKIYIGHIINSKLANFQEINKN